MLCTLLVAVVVARLSALPHAQLAEAASDLGAGQTIDRSIVVGHCGPTLPGECGEGSESGSWNTRRQRIRSLAQCAERCRACPSCSFVSYSKVQLGHNSNPITNALTQSPNPNPNLEDIERLLVVPTVRRAGAARMGRELIPHPAAARRRRLSATASASVVCTG